MRYLLALAFFVYLFALGTHSVVPPISLVPADIATSFVAQDTDLDDDMVSSACLHNSMFDDGLQNFDKSATPSLSFRAAKTARLVSTAAPAADRLDDGGLFRPPRA